MRVRRQSDGQVLTLAEANLLGKGGEARVYRLAEDPALVAKIWHKPTPERGSKVGAMIANPPSDPTVLQKHNSIAWPRDLLEAPTGSRQVVGFAMPFVSGMHPVIDFFNPKTRRQRCPLFNYFYLHRTARNLAIAIRALHERSYVIGDVNESNLLVAETALVTVVDTDSFQVWDPAHRALYRCRVGKPEFTPPELQGKTFGQVDRTIEHDLFGIGIVLFQLLMEGTHPFAGSYTGPGEPPPYEARIAAGYFPYSSGRQAPVTPKSTAPPFEMLHPTLQHMFVRCFQDGHFNPSARPDAQSWQWALEEAENTLVSCWFNDQHVYSGHLQACPWCERTKLLGGRDPFPSVESVKAGTHLGPAVAPPTSPHKAKAAPLHGSSNLPPPPIPRRVPVSRAKTKTTGKQPFAGFPGPRNDWALISVSLGALAILFQIAGVHGVAFPFGALAALLGAVGEVMSYGWYLDGKGRIPSRIGIALGLIPVFSFFARNVRELAG